MTIKLIRMGICKNNNCLLFTLRGEDGALKINYHNIQVKVLQVCYFWYTC